MLFIPWITLAVTRSPIAALGFTRAQIVRAFGWGMVVGGFWRIISILINFMAVDLGAGLAGWLPMFIGGVIWVPLVEETFFRGYLLRPLMHDLGRWTGILIQALLFCLHPVHLSQGVLALISVFGFGLIAGWIQDRFGSLWAAWGAHAFANILPLLVLLG